MMGEPGVGKITAIAVRISNRISRGDVPEDLCHKTIYSLDYGCYVLLGLNTRENLRVVEIGCQ
jgi:ATP-dependent Clp protease ATP-binding subunit ClpA